MGKVYVYPQSTPDEIVSLDTPATRSQYTVLYGAFKSYLSGLTLEQDGSNIMICGIQDAYVRDTRFSGGDDGCISVVQDDVLPFIGDIVIR